CRRSRRIGEIRELRPCGPDGRTVATQTEHAQRPHPEHEENHYDYEGLQFARWFWAARVGHLKLGTGFRIALQAPEVGANVCGALVAELAVFLKRLGNDVMEVRWQIGV